MKYYKYDTHIHTSEGSACSGTKGEDHAVKYKELGYDGIIITDHFFRGYCAVPNTIPWEERVELFCKGYENAKSKGEEIGLDVFFGFETSFDGVDILTYGLEKNFIIKHPEFMDVMDTGDVRTYINYVRENGGMCVHAHPFREAWYVPYIRLFPRDIDAVEIVNGSHTDKKFNDRAEYFAKSYDLPYTAGSDTHNHGEKNVTTGILVDRKLTSIQDYIDCVMNKKICKICE